MKFNWLNKGDDLGEEPSPPSGRVIAEGALTVIEAGPDMLSALEAVDRSDGENGATGELNLLGVSKEIGSELALESGQSLVRGGDS
jgi:hypothetical protein